MSLKCKAERFQFSDGEESCMLQDSSGMPMELPALYVMKKLRPNGDAPNTIENKMRALSVLYTWIDEHDFDIYERFSKGKLFDDQELEDLTGFCAKDYSLKGCEKVESIKVDKVVGMPSTKKKIRTTRTIEVPSVSNSTQYSRMTYIGPYLKWLAVRASNKSKQRVDLDTRNTIRDMVESFLDMRPPKKGKSFEPKSLTEKQISEIISIFDINSDSNPFEEMEVRFRNKVIFALLCYTGMRVGEMLGIKIKDINFKEGILTIHRRPNDLEDSRKKRARQKTTARELPIKKEVVLLIQEYIIKYRSKVKEGRKNPYLFISHKKSKRDIGSPLSISSVNKLFTKVRNSSDVLTNFHPHMLRHTWNDRFSAWIDSLPADKKYSEEKEAKVRRMLQGWSEGSSMDRHYNKRHITKEANKGSLEFQEKLLPDIDSNNHKKKGA